MAADNVTPTRQQPHEQIGRYQIIERIGRGAMGVVYRALDQAMGREVAIKLLVADLEDEPEIRARFLREAESAARLTHPNIITIFDLGEDRERLYIVMELLRGTTVKDLQRHSALPLDRKLELMIQLCAGLGAAHRAGIYHRDIKPGNLFVRTDGILKILDFGIARLATSNMTRAGFVVGTPDYMSPEQAHGGAIDGRSDIFSAGGVFYFMATGRKPFAATDLPGIFRQVEHEDPVPLEDAEAPPELANVIMKALAKDKAQRYQTCQDLVAALIDVRRRCAAVPPHVVVATPPVAKPAVAAAAADNRPHDGQRSAADPQPRSDDTVDFLPFAPPGTDDTVTLHSPGSRVRQFAGRVGSVIGKVVGRARSAGTRRTRRASRRKG